MNLLTKASSKAPSAWEPSPSPVLDAPSASAQGDLKLEPLPPRRILLIEDNQRDARLIQRLVAEESRDQIEVEWVQHLSEALPRLTSNHLDAVLLDLSLPDSHGLATLMQIRTKAPDMPVLVLTAAEDAELAMEAVKEGAQDYLFKSSLRGDLLTRSIQHSIVRQDLRREIDTLLAIDRQLLEALDDAWGGIGRFQEDGRYAWVNRSYASILGYGQADLPGTPWLDLVHPDDREAAAQHFQRMLNEGKTEFEVRSVRRDKSTLWVHLVIFQSLAGPGFYCFLRDVSDRKHAEASLQKTESRLRHTIDSFPIPVALVRLTDDTWMDANTRFLRVIGTSRDQLLGRRVRDPASHLQASDLGPLLDQVRRGEAVENAPVKLEGRLAEGKSVRVAISAAPGDPERQAVLVIVETATSAATSARAV